MKRIIALSSLFILLLMAVLPAGVSHAATANDAIKGITFFMHDGSKMNAVKNGSNFTFNLVGDEAYGEQVVDKVEIYSDSAVSLSVVPSDFDYSQAAPLTKDDLDIYFVNGTAVLDVPKMIQWSKRVNGDQFPEGEVSDYLFTLAELKMLLAPIVSSALEYGEESPYVFPGYVTDKDGNELKVSLTIITEGWKWTPSGWKVFNAEGQYVTGWFEDVDGNWYYLDNKTGAMKTGWFKAANGKWYYLKANGAMATGWAKVGTKWYFLSEKGDMVTGWVKYNGAWYYLKASGDMAIGWTKVNGTWYYLTGTGAMKTGWLKENNKWYYLKDSGAMVTGWYKVGSKSYYFYSNGQMR